MRRVGLLHIFINLLNVWLDRNSCYSLIIPIFLHSVCCFAFNQSIDMQLEKQEYFNNLSDNCGQSSLILHQKYQRFVKRFVKSLLSSRFFKSYNVQFETIQVNFLYSVTVKSIFCLAVYLVL